EGDQYDHPGGPLPLVRLDRLLRAPEAAKQAGPGRYALVAGEQRGRGVLGGDPPRGGGGGGQPGRPARPGGPRGRGAPQPGGGAAELGGAAAVVVLDPEALLGGETHVGTV